MSQTQISKIIEQESSLGLTTSNFTMKYIFPSQCPNIESFYYARLTPSPSGLLGLTLANQLKLRNLGSLMLIQGGVFLRLPITTTISAQILFHYFYQRVSFIDYDFRDIVMGAMFLAAQSEQTWRKSAHVALVFDQVFKIHQKSRRPTKIADLDSKEFKIIQSKTIEMSKVILVELGFEIHRLLDSPHRIMSSIFQLFVKHPKIDKIVKMSWGYLNDSYRTKLCLHYPGNIIASSCVYLSLRKLNLAVGSCAWWSLLETNLQMMEIIAGDILEVYENRTDYFGAQLILKELGQRVKKENVFPVPYYRKIQNQIYLDEKKGENEKKYKEKNKQRKDSRERSRDNQKKKVSRWEKKEKQRSKTPKRQNTIISIDSPEKQGEKSIIIPSQSLKASNLNIVTSQINQQIILRSQQQGQQQNIQEDLDIDLEYMSKLRSKFINNQNKNLS